MGVAICTRQMRSGPDSSSAAMAQKLGARRIPKRPTRRWKVSSRLPEDSGCRPVSAHPMKAPGSRFLRRLRGAEIQGFIFLRVKKMLRSVQIPRFAAHSSGLLGYFHSSIAPALPSRLTRMYAHDCTKAPSFSCRKIPCWMAAHAKRRMDCDISEPLPLLRYSVHSATDRPKESSADRAEYALGATIPKPYGGRRFTCTSQYSAR